MKFSNIMFALAVLCYIPGLYIEFIKGGEFTEVELVMSLWTTIAGSVCILLGSLGIVGLLLDQKYYRDNK